MPMNLYGQEGERKYLTPSERDAFLKAAEDAKREVRPSAAPWPIPRQGVYRAAPVPPAFLGQLKLGARPVNREAAKKSGRGVLHWGWSRGTAWTRVREVMEAAKITAPHATPRGLRHGFGIKAVTSGVSLNMVQKWLGTRSLQLPSIYADATGPRPSRSRSVCGSWSALLFWRIYMATIKVYQVQIYDISTNKTSVSPRMATREGAKIMGGAVLEDTEAEIDESQLEPGEQWTPGRFQALATP